MSYPPNNIRAIRQRMGLTLEQLAALTRHATKPDTETDLSTIQKIEKSVRKLTPEWQVNIAAALGVDPTELTGTLGAMSPVRRVPLAGQIAGGNWREAIEDPIDLIPTTKGGPSTFALTVTGDSMDKLVPSGTVIFVDPDDRELVDGRYYAMFRPGGETTFKQFRASPMRLEPCSHNPDHKTILVGDEGLITLGRVLGAHLDF